MLVGDVVNDYCNTTLAFCLNLLFFVNIEECKWLKLFRMANPEGKEKNEPRNSHPSVPGSLRPLGADGGHSGDVVRPLSEVRLQPDVVLAAQYLGCRRRRHQ